MPITGAHLLAYTSEPDELRALWPTDKGFGIGASMRLPGGMEMLLYEPRHPSAIERRP